MAALTVNSKFVSLTCNDSTFVSDHELEEPLELRLEVASKEESKSGEDCEREAVCAAVSPSGQFFAFCSNKSLSLRRTKDWSTVSERRLPRAASKIVFTPASETLIVADKSGDVYSYSTRSSEEEGKLLLGHLSVVLDVLVTGDERFVITCDRDEKIRVSRYPNAYNVHCYCLGHEEFVTSLALLPHDGELLLSASGDGTLALWHYPTGALKLRHPCSADLGPTDRRLPLLDVRTMSYRENASLVCVRLGNFYGIPIYSVSGKEGECRLKQIVETPLEPCCMTLGDDSLWLMFRDREQLLSSYDYSKSEDHFRLSANNVRHKLNKLDGLGRSLQISFKRENSFDQLYKRKYDNVKDYLEKKQARIGSSNEPKIKKVK